MNKKYIVSPQIRGNVNIGTEGNGLSVYLGQLAETGPARKVVFGGAKEFVSLIIGKRGSGKSHTLGAILEGFSTKLDQTSISDHISRRACLLLDPMGNFWTTAHLVDKNGTEKVKAQFASLDGWGCQPEPINVQIWIPAGFKTANDPDLVCEFRIKVSDLDAMDIADLLGINLLKDPQGAALHEAYVAIVDDGWTDGNQIYSAKKDYSFKDIIIYLEYLKNLPQSDHQPTTLKALIRSLKGLERQPVFSGDGTPMTNLLQTGLLSVLMLPLRVGSDLRRVITRLIIRRILREREEASQIKQRLDIEDLADDIRIKLKSEIEQRIPRTILALDEAQELLGDNGGEARSALEDYCLLGRNYGLSLILATQRPMASAISAKVRSQVDLYIIHRLLTQDDINVCEQNLLSLYPREMIEGGSELNFSGLVRSLDRGQAIITASYAMSMQEEVNRIVVVQVRPRITVHGGEVE